MPGKLQLPVITQYLEMIDIRDIDLQLDIIECLRKADAALIGYLQEEQERKRPMKKQKRGKDHSSLPLSKHEKGGTA